MENDYFNGVDKTLMTKKASPALRKKSRRNWNRIIRRVHLYLGLALIPWLLLYGATALLFNHGSWMTDREYYSLPAVELDSFPTAESVAQQALTKLEQENFQLVPNSAKWVGSLSLRGKMEDHTVRLRVQPDGAGGMLMHSPPKETPPEWTTSLKDWSPIAEETEREIESITQDTVANILPDVESVTLSRYPKLQFQIQEQNTIHTVELNMDGKMSLTPMQGTAHLRKKLLRLHVLHGDPGYAGARWIWIRIVDAMGIAMLVWGFTGLLMWWTIRPTRKQGAVALAIGISTMIALAVSLWAAMGLA